jgi:5-oxoprolinase (ATP-hydrolysing) subunit A
MSDRTFVDLNADVGEGCGHDVSLMPLISSANIACGLHAGDDGTMREAVRLARDHNVAVGAHPSFPDREHFGRREMQLSAEDLQECIVAQVRTLADVAAAAGARVRHVKPHGALYNMAARDETLAEAVVAAIARVDPSLAVFGLAGSALVKAALRIGLQSVSEAFADRAYRADGSLLPRDQPGSVLHDTTAVAARAVAMARDGSVVAVDGRRIRVQADTICIHGDTPGAPALARMIRDSLVSAGIAVAAPPQPKERR